MEDQGMDKPTTSEPNVSPSETQPGESLLESPSNSSSPQNIEDSHKLHTQNIAMLTSNMDKLMEDKTNYKEVVSCKEKLDTALNCWKDYLNNYVETPADDVENAKLYLTQVNDNIKSMEMRYRQYQDSCVSEHSFKELPQTIISKPHPSKASSSSSRRVRLLELEAQKKMQEAEFESQKKMQEAKLESQKKMQEAQYLMEKSRILAETSSRRSSSHHPSLVEQPVKSRKVSIRQFSARPLSEPNVSLDPHSFQPATASSPIASDTGVTTTLGQEFITLSKTGFLNGPSQLQQTQATPAISKGLVHWISSCQTPVSSPGSTTGPAPLNPFLPYAPTTTVSLHCTNPPPVSIPYSNPQYVHAHSLPPVLHQPSPMLLDVCTTPFSTALTPMQPSVNPQLVKPTYSIPISMPMSHSLPNPFPALPQSPAAIPQPAATPIPGMSHIPSAVPQPVATPFPVMPHIHSAIPQPLVPPQSAMPQISSTFPQIPVPPTPAIPQITSALPPPLPLVPPKPLLTQSSFAPPRAAPILPTNHNPVNPSVAATDHRFASKDDLLALYRTVNQGFNVPGIKVPKFKGDPTQYHVFIRTFDNIIGRHTQDPSTLLTQLIEHCTEEAKESIQHLALSDDFAIAYQQAKDILLFRFGNRSLVINAHIKQLTTGPNIQANDVKALCKLASQMRNCLIIFSSWRAEATLDAHAYLEAVFNRLPRSLRNDYVFDASWLQCPIPSFTHLLKFIENRAYLYNTFYGRAMADLDAKFKAGRSQNARAAKASTYTAISSSQTQTGSQSAAPKSQSQSAAPKPGDGNASYQPKPQQRGTKPCPCCTELHSLYQCQKFIDKDIEARRTFLTEKSLCRNCMRSTRHFAKDCPSDRRCQAEGCGRAHHTLLHLRKMPPKTKVPSTDSNQNQPSSDSKAVNTVNAFTNVMTSKSAPCAVRLTVVPVTIINPTNGNKADTYAFLDSGSTRSFLKADLADQLGLTGTPENCSVSTLFKENKTVLSGNRISFEIKGTDEPEIIQVNNALTIDAVPDVNYSIPTTALARKYPHLEDLEFPSVNADVEVLIGFDVLHRLDAPVKRKSTEGTLYAEHTALGWSIVGTDPDLITIDETVNFIATKPSPIDLHSAHSSMPMCHVCKNLFCDLCADPCATEPSLNDKKAQQIVESSFQIEDGQITVGLPWADEDCKLPSNMSVAKTRLNGLVRKFKSDTDFYHRYRDKIQELFDNDFAEVIPEDELMPTDKTWYLPHHATKQAKFRVVFDTAAEYEGTSLCKKLLPGPDNNNSLCGVLMRFRRSNYAFSCDISAMYHRIHVSKPDREALRFLWFPNHDFTKPPIQCRMKSLIFGANASPSIAIFALHKLAELNLSNSNPLVTENVCKNFYVDDGLISCDTLADAKLLVTQLTELLATGNFPLTKFLANDPEILESVPEQDKLPAATSLEFDDDAIGRTLGMTWNARTDEFEFQVNIQSKPQTRRGMLSEMSQIFDPLGLIQPFVLPARLILQDLGTTGCDWDETVTGTYHEKWKDWISKLNCLNGLAVRRCYRPKEFVPTLTELHVFCDASTVAYGVCAYLRQINAEGKVICSFVRGISRVNPKQIVSIPRLELTAAVAAVELTHNIKKELELKTENVHFHTDSTTVLQMINNRTQRFKIFVANRLNVIHLLSRPEQWHHVSTKQNPADIGSRGLQPDKIGKAELWLHGPQFLRDSATAWPMSPSESKDISDPEIAHEIKVNFIQSKKTAVADSCLHDLLHYYSKFEKLRAAVARMLRLKKFLMWKHLKIGDKPSVDSLTAAELETASKEIVKLIQADAMPNELQYFKNHTHAGPPVDLQGKLNSPFAKALLKCNAFINEDVLCVGGRLLHADLPPEQKNPMILPPYHHATKLLIDMHHRISGHSGTLYVLSILRRKYWILRGQAAVAKAIRECLPCRMKSAQTGEQWMADLPAPRVCAGSPPFDHTFVDMFGPIKVKIGRSEHKRYGTIYTCLATRSVHLEVAESLDTSAFLQTFTRFISRRSCPSHMYSDNGTNFTSASKVLKEGINRWNMKQINSELAQKGVTWHFSPPLASHQNGVVERLIREVKKILQNLTNDRPLSDYSLWTLLTSVESIMNDRPLTKLSDDPRDLNALSPSSILISKLDPSLPPDMFLKSDEYRRGYRHVQRLIDVFWQRFTAEYLPLLQQRTKWLQPSNNFQPGQMVLMCDDITPRGQWPKAIVEETYPDKQGIVRRVKVRTSNSSYVRDVRKLCLLELV